MKTGDWIIRDTTDNRLHYVESEIFGATGTLYRHDGTSWTCVICRSANKGKKASFKLTGRERGALTKILGNDTTAADLIRKLKNRTYSGQEAFKKAVEEALNSPVDEAILSGLFRIANQFRTPDHLRWVEGKEGDLLIVAASGRNRQDIKDLLGQDCPFSYMYLRRGKIEEAQSGDKVEEAQTEWDVWKMQHHGATTEITTEELRKIQEELRMGQKIQDTITPALMAIKKNPKRWHEMDQVKETVKECLKVFYNEILPELVLLFITEAVPSPTAGTASVQTIINQIAEMAGSPGLLPSQFAQSGHESVALGFVCLFDCIRLYELLQKTRLTEQDIKEIKRVSMDLALNIPKGPPAIMAGVKVIVDAATCGVGIQGVTTAAAYMGIISAAVSFATAARDVRRGGKVCSRIGRMNKTLDTIKSDDERQARFEDSEFNKIMHFAVQKQSRRANKHGVMAVTGVVGGVGGVALGGMAIAGTANIWNPGGWIIAGVGGLGAIGVTSYVLYRYITKYERRARRREKGKPVSPEDFADKLIHLYQAQHDFYEDAEWILKAFGIDADGGQLGGMSRSDAKDVIVGHLTGN